MRGGVNGEVLPVVRRGPVDALALELVDEGWEPRLLALVLLSDLSKEIVGLLHLLRLELVDVGPELSVGGRDHHDVVAHDELRWALDHLELPAIRVRVWPRLLGQQLRSVLARGHLNNRFVHLSHGFRSLL